MKVFYQEALLAVLYDPDKMPDDLRAAHKALDAAVEAAYGVDFHGDEENKEAGYASERTCGRLSSSKVLSW